MECNMEFFKMIEALFTTNEFKKVVQEMQKVVEGRALPPLLGGEEADIH